MSIRLGDLLLRTKRQLPLFATPLTPSNNLNSKFSKPKLALISFISLTGVVFCLWVWQAATAAPGSNADAPAQTNVGLQQQVQSGVEEQGSATSQNINNDSSSNVEIKVNGQPVAVPSSGDVHKTIHQQNGTTTIDVQQNSTSTDGGSDVYVQSNSSTHTNTYSDSNNYQQTGLGGFMF